MIPRKASFLPSIQALRQMRAKLDCERDTLEIPGIGVIKLTSLFLFVFALKPTVNTLATGHDHLPPMQGLSATSSKGVNQALMMVERAGEDLSSADIVVPVPLLQQSDCDSDCSDCESFLRCAGCTDDERVSVHGQGGLGNGPEYIHVGAHLVETFSNGHGQTWRCGICRTKCKTYRGRTAKWNPQVMYSHRPSQGLCSLHGSGTYRVRCCDTSCHRRYRAPERRRALAPKVQECAIPFDVRKIILLRRDLHPKALPPQQMEKFMKGPSAINSMSKTQFP